MKSLVMFEYSFGFWVNGVLACCCAVIGLLLNFITIYILTIKKGLRNVFNRLLLCLCWFDNCVLTIWILARLYIDFEVRPNVFIWMFPYFTFLFHSNEKGSCRAARVISQITIADRSVQSELRWPATANL